MRYLILVLGLFLTADMAAQEQYTRPPYDHVWLLNGSRLDFNYSPVEVIADDQPMPFEGTNASICDETGELLMYTNGIYISGGEGDTIPNGNNINPGIFSDTWADNGFVLPQMAIILKSLLGVNYYVLHNNAIRLSEVNEFGDIHESYNLSQTIIGHTNDRTTTILKNDTVVVGRLDVGHLTATRSADGSSWWLLEHQNYTNVYEQVVLAGDSIWVAGQTQVGEDIRQGVGQAKFSPQGDKYARLDLVNVGTQTLSIYDFDRCSGELSNPVYINYEGTNFTGGLAFSENGRFLYVPIWKYVYQYDLAAEDIIASQVTVGDARIDTVGYYMAQLAPDAKIYICTQGSHEVIHVIQQPNHKGHACEFRQSNITLPTFSLRTIPNFPYYGLGPLDGSPCDTLGIDNPVPEAFFEYTSQDSSLQVEFFDASHFMPTYTERLLDARIGWRWDFGDGSADDTIRFPVHTFPVDGSYEVCLTVSNVTGADTYCEGIFVGTTAVTEVVEEQDILEVFPNPAQDYFMVSFSDNLHEAYLELYNSVGQRVRRERVFAGENKIQIEEFPSGVYTFQLWDNGLRLGSGKVIKAY